MLGLPVGAGLVLGPISGGMLASVVGVRTSFLTLAFVLLLSTL